MLWVIVLAGCGGRGVTLVSVDRPPQFETGMDTTDTNDTTDTDVAAPRGALVIEYAFASYEPVESCAEAYLTTLAVAFGDTDPIEVAFPCADAPIRLLDLEAGVGT